MISDLVDLLFPSSDYVSDMMSYISDLVNGNGTATSRMTSIDLGCALIPWDNILAALVLIVFIVCLFKFMRTVLTKLL